MREGLPDATDREGVEPGVNADHRDVESKGLSSDDAVERVAMVADETARAKATSGSIGRIVKPASSTDSTNVRSRASASGSFPSRTLVAISHAEAAEMRTRVEAIIGLL
jgi:hypothetical protein